MVETKDSTSSQKFDYVMFLDAEEQTVDLLRPALENEGYHLLNANSPDEALRLCQSFRPKVILPDLSRERTKHELMEFIGCFRESMDENIGIILLTNNSAPECKELRGIRYVREPFLQDDLVCALKEVEQIVLLKDERDMLLEQVTEYAKGLEKMVYDQTKELKTANEKLRELSITDDLTGLYNRRYFFERLDEEINQSIRYYQSLSVMIMDLDNFKAINDCMGHMVGDDVLREFANLLKEKLRKGETVARYGGEEFSVILPHVGSEGALKAARCIRKVVEAAEFSCSPEGIKVTVSIGVAELDSGIKDPDEVLARADKALYEAKRLGKNTAYLWPTQEKK